MSNKIGRNDSCPCGSGKKYKKCCINSNNPSFKQATMETLPPEIMKQFRAHEAAERIRAEQQGYGRPIISWMDNNSGYRIVAVANQIFWSKNWLVFQDFLIHFMKHTLGLQWGQRESQNPDSTHPLFRWFRKFQDYQSKTIGTGKIKSAQMVGFAASIMHLGYALYLIEHHDNLPKTLLKRLRDPATFRPAYYETLAGSLFAVAGFTIRCEEVKKSAKPTPEFSVTSKASGKVYNVEAKCKDSWTSKIHEASNEEFCTELAAYVRNQIYKASKKKLTNAIFWIELSLPSLTNSEKWMEIVKIVKSTILDAEKNITIDGKPAGSAYVIVTNHTFLANENIQGGPIFASLEVFNTPDFIPNGIVDIEEALEAYDRHRDIMWALECINIFARIPTTFDGTPHELMDNNGQPVQSIKLGDRYAFPDATKNERIGIIEEMTSGNGKEAYAIIRDEENKTNNIVQIPLTEPEQLAFASHGEAIFGKPNAPRNIPNGDLFAMYNRIIEMNKKFNKQQLLKQLENHPNYNQYKELSRDELSTRFCREMTKRIHKSS
jgi:hypothetical protein